MKYLAILFAAIALPSTLLGFGMTVMPFLSLFGKVAAFLSITGFAITVFVWMTEELFPQFESEMNDIRP